MARPVKKIKLQECLEILHQEFEKIDDPRSFSLIKLSDILMSSFAIFNLKHPSLLQFEASMRSCARKNNLKSIFGINSIPSDTQLRDVLDPIPFSKFRPLFKSLFSTAQRSKLLEKFEFMRYQSGHYIFSQVMELVTFAQTKSAALTATIIREGKKESLRSMATMSLEQALCIQK